MQTTKPAKPMTPQATPGTAEDLSEQTRFLLLLLLTNLRQR